MTIGYGCNVEDNPDLIKNTPLLYKGKALTEEEKAAFLACHKKKTARELAEYSISKTEAIAIVKKFTYAAIKNLTDIFKDEKNQQSVFFDLPIPMQVLALDVYFNLGRKKFSKYKRLKQALLGNDYAKAVKEAVVYTGKNRTNTERERRKKRLLNITRIIQENPKQSMQTIQDLVAENYHAETPKLIRVLAGAKDRICENAIICGEFERTQNKLQIAQNKRLGTKRV